MATLLANIQTCALELGLTFPAQAVNGTDELVLQLVALMNRQGDTLLTEQDANVMTREHRFQTVVYDYTGDTTDGDTLITSMSSVTGLSSRFAVSGTGIPSDTFVTDVSATTVTTNQPATATGTTVALTFSQVLYDMPSDYERMANRTVFEKSSFWPVYGPKTAQEWQFLKSAQIASGPRYRYRIIGNKFAIFPAPPDGLTFGFEYQSNAWVTGEDGDVKTSFTADTDTCAFPDRLMILGTKMRFFQIKGFDSSALERDYIRELMKWKANEAGADTLSMAARRADEYLTTANLPESGYGQ